MKPLLTLLRISIVGILWSILFVEGIRVILLTNWYFDIFRSAHWAHAWNLWRSGWVIDKAKEWAFVLIILTAVPVWATVWAALSMIKWENFFAYIQSILAVVWNKLFSATGRPAKESISIKRVEKKPSYKEIRPKNAYVPLEKSVPNLSPERRAQLSGVPYKPQAPQPALTPAAKPAKKEFSHSLFELSDDDSFDFDLFDDKNNDTPAASPKDKSSDNIEKSSAATKKKRTENTSSDSKTKNYHSNSTFETLKQKGYEVVSGITVKDIFIDFVGISKNHICLCLNDKETGDWLADEERFNDEEPLWFSESSHRISPVRKIAIARDALEEKLSAADFKIKIVPYVIEQIGNIINAEDMFDIWKDLHINVTRIDRGTPKEIPLFAKKLEDAESGIDKGVLDKLKRLLRNTDD